MTPRRMSIVVTVTEDEAGYHVRVEGPGRVNASASYDGTNYGADLALDGIYHRLVECWRNWEMGTDRVAGWLPR